jgi:hypothetical protein
MSRARYTGGRARDMMSTPSRQDVVSTGSRVVMSRYLVDWSPNGVFGRPRAHPVPTPMLRAAETTSTRRATAMKQTAGQSTDNARLLAASKRP